MTFLANNWVLFGFATASSFVLLLINYIRAVKKIAKADLSGFSNSLISYILLLGLIALFGIPFLIGAVYHIIEHFSPK